MILIILLLPIWGVYSIASRIVICLQEHSVVTVIPVSVLIILGVTLDLLGLAGYSLKKTLCLMLTIGWIWVSCVCLGELMVTVNLEMFTLRCLICHWQVEVWYITKMVTRTLSIHFI